MHRRHHNRRWRLIGARRNADFLPCRGNREIERKERGRERRRVAQSTTRVPMWNQAKKGEILNDREQMSNCAGEGKGRSTRSGKVRKARERAERMVIIGEKEWRHTTRLFSLR